MRVLHCLFSPLAMLAVTSLAPLAKASEWPHYGGDAGGSRHAQANQIEPGNVDQLEQAWVYHSGETGDGYASGDSLTFEATPVFWQDRLYFNSSFGKAYAIDAQTGQELWRFDAGFDRQQRYSETAARGVTLWHTAGADPQAGNCAHRVLFGDLRGHLHALDALTGKPCSAFGVDGAVDLTQGVGPVENGNYTITSPPAILGDTLFVGSAIGDNRQVESEHGIVRAIDIRTGKILWTWDPIPRNPNDPAWQTWSGDSAAISGGANAWPPLAIDAALERVYVPTSAPSPDFYGGHRVGDNLYANSVVALDAKDGSVVWHQQLVHHDVWDYDTPAQPVLVDIDLGQGTVPAVVQVTKTGMMYVFDRRSGTPLIPVEERPVPQSPVPGETLSPTQPFSTLPPLVNHAPLSEEDAFGILFFDKRDCANRIRQYRSDGIFTPPTLEGSLFRPGYAGGANWGGTSVDAQRKLAITFVMELPTMVRLVPRDSFDPDNRPELNMGWSRMSGTPYVMQRDVFLSFLGLPCTQPPWGKLVAMDLENRRIAWSRQLGTIRDLAPAVVPNFDWGVPGMGGPITTESGLIFIAATADNRLRALDIASGEELWKADLPHTGAATPMTYMSGGRQYVVIAAGGHGQFTPTVGDAVVAFALPL